MLGSHSDEQVRDTISRVRDIVEIVAIVLAGAWAAYQFIYLDRIKPSQAPPVLVVDVHADVVARRGNDVVVRVRENFRNAGHIEFRFLGNTLIVVGSRIVPIPGDQLTTIEGNAAHHVDASVARIGHSRVLFRAATTYANTGNPNIRQAAYLQPDETMTSDTIVILPRNTFPFVQVYGDYKITKYLDRAIPLAIDPRKDGTIALRVIDQLPGCEFAPSERCPAEETAASTALAL